MNGPERHDEFKERVHAWAKRVRVAPTQVRVQAMSRKWASCSSRGWCTFATDLLGEPHAFQDYVIVHELLHLKLRNHGRVFRSVLSAHVPGWRRFCANGLGTSCLPVRSGDGEHDRASVMSGALVRSEVGVAP